MRGLAAFRILRREPPKSSMQTTRNQPTAREGSKTQQQEEADDRKRLQCAHGGTCNWYLDAEMFYLCRVVYIQCVFDTICICHAFYHIYRSTYRSTIRSTYAIYIYFYF